MDIEYGQRLRTHPTIGYSKGTSHNLHLLSLETYNNVAFCGAKVGTPEVYASGTVCETCIDLLGVAHSDFYEDSVTS
jgi:hypothetical protein